MQQHEQWQAIGIGWDVRGWQGKAQAVAVVGWSPGRPLDWLGISPLFRLSSRCEPNLRTLLAPALPESLLLERVLAHPCVTLGIDAPLTFPAAFVDLLREGQGPRHIPEREIDNPYAYRDCDRWLYRQYGKKPLSASFDRLGNNATLAMAILPALVQGKGHSAIEVYPALAKVAGRGSEAWPELRPHLPSHLVPGTDPYDAALCALMALQQASKGGCEALPELVKPQVQMNDGWIYHFAREEAQ